MPISRLLAVALLSCAEVAAAGLLHLGKFYGGDSRKYEWVFGTEPSCNSVLLGSGIRSPTKPAVQGLEAALSGNLPLAKRCELLLRQFAHRQGDALFFRFKQDYIGEWPYHLHAPWSSSLTQGVALGLYVALAQSTGDPYYAEQSRRVFASYLVPLERGGFARAAADGVILEEYPTSTQIAVLNGALVSAIALKDYAAWSGDRRADALFQRAATWLDRNIANYNVITPEGKSTSAYSLAPRRLDVLFRFAWGKGEVEIDSIAVEGRGLRYEIPVGDRRADQQSVRSASLIVSPAMNWTQPLKLDGRLTRKITPGLGKFDHAPFRVQVHSAEDLRKWAFGVKVRVTYKSATQVDLQINDGREYHLIAKVQPSRQFKTVEFIIPQAAIRDLRFPTGKAVNEFYVGHNQQLTAIFAEVAGSEVMRRQAQLWAQ